MMRIAVVSTSKIPSTTANSIQVMKICQAYKQLGFDVNLFVPGFTKANWGHLSKFYGITTPFKITYVPSIKFFRRYDFVTITGILIALKRMSIIHTWLPQVAHVSGFLKIPYLLELHELPTGKFGPSLFKRLFRSKHQKRFLPISSALKNLYENTFNFQFNQNEVRIAPDGVDLERYQVTLDGSTLREKLGINDSFLAVYTGHLYKGRGMDLLIKLAEKLPEVYFLWVGGREAEVSYWNEFIKEKHINNIRITGFIENEYIPLYQSIGDVLLMPYEKKVSGSSGGNTADFCSPMKMFEYMATGKPIISSNLPVFHEVLNNDNAIFCDYENVDQWINAIQKIKNFPEVGLEIGEQAKKDVQGYSWTERAKKTLDGFINE